MRYNQLGRTGLFVSELCLGTMTFGAAGANGQWGQIAKVDQEAADRLVERSLAAGINFIDTANVYSFGESERILGQSLKNLGVRRQDVVIATKFHGQMGAGPNERGSSRGHIMDQVEQSLERLGTDHIDLYQVHGTDTVTPIDETLRALDDLVSRGLVRYVGVSNWQAWRIAKALGISRREGLARFELVQPMYNLVKRQAEVELFPLVMEEGLGAMVYSPLASGLLTGLYGLDRRPETGRLAQPRYTQRYGDDAFYAVADRFSTFARDNGHAPAALAVAWARSHPAVTAPIVGADTPEQLDGILAALDIAMTPDLRAAITALSIPPDESIEREVD